jgi:hypothetical protein
MKSINMLSSIPRHLLQYFALVCLMLSLAPLGAQTDSLTFSAAGSLNPKHWQTNTPLLANLARNPKPTRWVTPQLTFSPSGMRMAGVNGTFQFTGVQSTSTFTAPFQLRTTVTAEVANGNAFAVMLVSADSEEKLRIEGNVNPRNGSYHGVWLNAGKDKAVNIVHNAQVGVPYTFSILIGDNGTASVTAAAADGHTLGSASDLNVGPGPFYIVLGQREGMPYTVGKNVALWSSVKLQSHPATDEDEGAAATNTPGPGIRSVDFQNFDYTSICFAENGPAETVHISKGQSITDDEQFFANKPGYGDLKGDGHEQAVVVMNCHPGGMSPNVAWSEVFIFEMSGSGPKLLAELPPNHWNNALLAGATVRNQQLAVNFFDLGNGPRACPEWIVTSKLRWDGSRFIKAGPDTRKKNTCSR